MMKISILTPFYNEASAIKQYFDTIIPILEKLTTNYEIVCVDDGSLDKTFTLLQKYHQTNPNIKVIKLAKRFGKEIALSVAFDYCHADCAITLDSDLQDPPQLIPKMVEKWQEGYKVVLMKQTQRSDSKFRNIISRISYTIIDKISNKQIPKHIGEFRLLDKKIIEIIKSIKEKNRIMKGILSFAEFKAYTISYNRVKRRIGYSKFNATKLLNYAIDTVFLYSPSPVKFFRILFAITILGSIISLFYGPWLISLTLFFGSINVLGFYILGEYLIRILKEAQNKPLYIIEQTLLSSNH